jgi:hypothetical protein
VFVPQALGSRAAVGLTDSVITHLPLATLGVGFTGETAPSVDADVVVPTLVVEDTFELERRIVQAGAFNTALSAGALFAEAALVGAKPVATELIVPAVGVGTTKVLAQRAHAEDARLARFAVVGRAAGEVLFEVHAAARLAALLATAVALVGAERATLTPVAVGALETLVVVGADIERDTAAVLAACGGVETVAVGVTLGDSGATVVATIGRPGESEAAGFVIGAGGGGQIAEGIELSPLIGLGAAITCRHESDHKDQTHPRADNSHVPPKR